VRIGAPRRGDAIEKGRIAPVVRGDLEPRAERSIATFVELLDEHDVAAGSREPGRGASPAARDKALPAEPLKRAHGWLARTFLSTLPVEVLGKAWRNATTSGTM